MPEPVINSPQELLDRLQASAAALEALKRVKSPPTIKRDSLELYQGRYYITLQIQENGVFRVEICSATTTREVIAAADKRIAELLL